MVRKLDDNIDVCSLIFMIKHISIYTSICIYLYFLFVNEVIRIKSKKCFIT